MSIVAFLIIRRLVLLTRLSANKDMSVELPVSYNDWSLAGAFSFKNQSA